jgi:ribosome-binding factor A
MQGTTVKRAVRVSERIREELARAISRDLGDPRVAHAVITQVSMPDDLQLARVSVRLATGGADLAARKRLIGGLVAAMGFLRKRVGKNVGLRHAPELRFEYDEGQDASTRIDEVLNEIKREASEP